MNDLIKMNTEQTMSSLDVAKLVGTDNSKIVDTISRISKELNWSLASRAGENSRGKSITLYDLTKNQSILIVSNYNNKFLEALISRWDSLENNQPKMTLLETANMAMDGWNNEVAEHAKTKKRLSLANRFLKSEGDQTIEQFVKTSGIEMGRNRFYAFLREEKFIQQNKFPYQVHLNAGILSYKVSDFEDHAPQYQVFITPKGVGKFVKLLAEDDNNE